MKAVTNYDSVRLSKVLTKKKKKNYLSSFCKNQKIMLII